MLFRSNMFLAGSVGKCFRIPRRIAASDPNLTGQSLSMVIVFACLIPGTASAANGAVLGLFLFLVFFGSTWLQVRCPFRTPVSFLCCSFANPRFLYSSPGCTPPRSTLSALVPMPTLSRPCPTGASTLAFRQSLCSRVQLRRLFNFAVVQWTPIMLTSITWGTFLFVSFYTRCLRSTRSSPLFTRSSPS